MLENLIDYAGLFPPAGLDMSAAVRNYARYLDSEHSWILARFVVPVNRLNEFEQARASLVREDHDEESGAVPFPTGEGASRTAPREWKLSILLGPDPAANIEQIAEFNLRNAGLARIDSVEGKVSSSREVRAIAALLPAETTAYFEISLDHTSELLPVIREVGACAKLRTGGITPDAIPSPETVAAFIAECARSQVGFKATAGLHHPIRCVRPLTYAREAPRAAMHGFLNVLFAAAVAYRHAGIMGEGRALPKLHWTAPQFEFTQQSAVIRHYSPGAQDTEHYRPATASVPTAFIRHLRREFFISFGSCSFEEPISDLQELNLL